MSTSSGGGGNSRNAKVDNRQKSSNPPTHQQQQPTRQHQSNQTNKQQSHQTTQQYHPHSQNHFASHARNNNNNTRFTQSKKNNANSNRYYYFNGACDKKSKALNRVQEAKNGTVPARKILTNTIKIINYNKKIKINNEIIFDSLNELAIANDLSVAENIQIIKQSRSRIVWQIKFKENFDSKLIINKELTIADKKFQIIDANTYPSLQEVELKAASMAGWLRCHWLPIGTSCDQVRDFLEEVCNQKINSIADEISINKIEPEMFKKESMKHISSGIFKIQINFPVVHAEELKTIIDEHLHEDEKVLIELCGHPLRCRLCKSFDHQTKNCEKRN